jgi:hypothetical protein
MRKQEYLNTISYLSRCDQSECDSFQQVRSKCMLLTKRFCGRGKGSYSNTTSYCNYHTSIQDWFGLTFGSWSKYINNKIHSSKKHLLLYSSFVRLIHDPYSEWWRITGEGAAMHNT